MILAERVRELRGAARLTQEQVARGAGLTLNAYGNIERGQNSPNVKTVAKIAVQFDMSLAEIFEGVEVYPLSEATIRTEAKPV